MAAMGSVENHPFEQQEVTWFGGPRVHQSPSSAGEGHTLLLSSVLVPEGQPDPWPAWGALGLAINRFSLLLGQHRIARFGVQQRPRGMAVALRGPLYQRKIDLWGLGTFHQNSP